MPKLNSDRFRISVEWMLAAFAVFILWNAVRWAFEPGLFLYMDEIGNLTRFIDFSYWQNVSVLPAWIYNDRPVGFVLARALYDLFGFHYVRQLSAYMFLHLANCIMGFLLSRRLGVSVPLSLAAVGLYGGLWTTVQTVTYIGAVFDVTCLFFLLGSILAFLSDRRGSTLVSALLFFLALRSKEIAIALPVLLVILRLRSLGMRALLLKVWPHFLIAAVIGLRYLSFVPKAMQVVGPQDPYRADLKVTTIFHSLASYTALILGPEGSAAASATILFASVAIAMVVYAFWRRNDGILFSLAAYVLFLLPVSAMPGLRSVYYVYAPQMFLILAGAILTEDLIAFIFKRPGVRWVAAMGVSVALLAWALVLQMNPVVTNGRMFLLTARRTSATTARSAQALLPLLQPKSHIYVNQGTQSPWLLIPGPCAYFKLATSQTAVACSLSQTKDALESMYQQDAGPKVLADYKRDGSLSVVAIAVP